MVPKDIFLSNYISSHNNPYTLLTDKRELLHLDFCSSYFKLTTVNDLLFTELHYLFIDKINKAIAIFNQALVLNPSHQDSMIGLAKVYRKLEKNDKAEELLKKLDIHQHMCKYYF